MRNDDGMKAVPSPGNALGPMPDHPGAAPVGFGWGGVGLGKWGGRWFTGATFISRESLTRGCVDL